MGPALQSGCGDALASMRKEDTPVNGLLEKLLTLPELREYITNITQNVVVDMDKEGFEQFVRAFQGLTISTVKTILSKALARSGKISLDDLQLVLEEKKQVIRKTQVLEFFNAEETMGSIGGMDVLKSWIVTRGMAFSEQAQQFGLPMFILSQSGFLT